MFQDFRARSHHNSEGYHLLCESVRIFVTIVFIPSAKTWSRVRLHFQKGRFYLYLWTSTDGKAVKNSVGNDACFSTWLLILFSSKIWLCRFEKSSTQTDSSQGEREKQLSMEERMLKKKEKKKQQQNSFLGSAKYSEQ